jgi:hypothetical protein
MKLSSVNPRQLLGIKIFNISNYVWTEKIPVVVVN